MKRWTTKDFPVALYKLHPDQSVNFQMNRFYNWSNDQKMLDEMKKAGEFIHSYDDYIKSFLALGKEALKMDDKLKAALYFRGAEFFIPEGSPNKQELRRQFISLNNEYYGVTKDQHHLIPFGDGFLSAYRFTPEHPKGTIVFLNGFDGYIEECTRMFMVFKDAGYDTVAFDGPGQGTVLEDYRIPMTHEWEKPAKAVLDYFDVDGVTVIGGSLGGCLALRTAAYEKRVKRAICYDLLPDFFSVTMRQVPPEVRDKFKSMIIQGTGKDEINALIKQMMQKSLMLEWGLTQGMNVMGCDSPYDFLQKTTLFNTADFSPRITQDVLLLAGQDDHYVPIEQLPEQIKTLTNVRSLTARMFTAKETAGNHCQLGNIGLAIDVMLNWIEQVSDHTQHV
ncbi:MAG: alpha/beta fold hydrolase [Bacillota bacterium]|nr:alpha/beta fold hydrolase [Bacillota bacterium]